jgi:hypothetical protein
MALYLDSHPPPLKPTVNKLYSVRLPLPAWALIYYFDRFDKMSSLTADATTWYLQTLFKCQAEGRPVVHGHYTMTM